MGEGAPEKFEVKIGLRQGSVLSPLLFISVLDLISRNTVMKDAMKKLLCRRPGPAGEWQTGATADTGGVEQAVNLTRAEDKSRPPEGRAGHRAKGEETDSGEQFRVHSRDSVRRREDGEREVRRRAQAGAYAWRAVEGVMADRRI